MADRYMLVGRLELLACGFALALMASRPIVALYALLAVWAVLGIALAWALFRCTRTWNHVANALTVAAFWFEARKEGLKATAFFAALFGGLVAL